MWFDLFAFCYLPVMLRPLHFLSRDCDISLWLNAQFLWNPVQSLPSGSSSPPSQPQSQFACEECWHLMWSFSPSLPSLFDGSHLSISSQFYFLLWTRPLPLASTTSFWFSWNKFWTEKENNFHFLKRGYFLSVVKRCLSVISKGNLFQSLKFKFIRDGWIDFVFSVFLNLISFASWMDLRSFYS